MRNGGFEDAAGSGSAPAFWAATGGVLERTTTGARSAAAAARFTVADSTTTGFWQAVAAQPVTQYLFTVSCAAADQLGLKVWASVAYYSAAGGQGNLLREAVSSPLVLDGSYRPLAAGAGVSAPAGTASLRAWAWVQAAQPPATITCDDAALALSSATPTATATVTPTVFAPPSSGGNVGPPAPTHTSTPLPVAIVVGDFVISEVMFHPLEGDGRRGEWVELAYHGAKVMTVRGLALRDNHEADVLPAFEVAPSDTVLVVTAAGALARVAQATRVVVVVPDGTIGNGLSDTGDRLALLDGDGRVLDGVSWGADSSINNPPCPSVRAGHSLQRLSAPAAGRCGVEDNPGASPGLPNRPVPTPTATATRTQTRTATPTRSPAPTLIGTPLATATPVATVTPTPAQATAPAEAVQEPEPPSPATSAVTPTAELVVVETPAAPATVTPVVAPVQVGGAAGPGPKPAAPEAALGVSVSRVSPPIDAASARGYAQDAPNPYATTFAATLEPAFPWGALALLGLVASACIAFRALRR